MSAETTKRRLPACWGHRGASAAFPENTLASFEAAIRDGAEGFESDVHVSLDGVVVMFHDPALGRTTNGTGNIRERNWYGEDGMEHLRTLKEPHQPIPTLPQTLELLMKPENKHVEFNVDVKVYSDPEKLFSLMKTAIEAHPEWETALAPRIVLGLWHPRFLAPAHKYLPYCRRTHIGIWPWFAREYFWDACDGFSIAFSTLTTWEGARFLRECQAAGKRIFVWTVNTPEQMADVARWGVDVVITDYPRRYLDFRAELATDYDKAQTAHRSWTHIWTDWKCYTPIQMVFRQGHYARLEKFGGKIEKAVLDDTAAPVATSIA